MKKLDYFLIAVYIFLSLGMGLYFSTDVFLGSHGNKVLEIYSENNLYATYNLPVKELVELRVDSDFGYNIIIVENDNVRVLESNCRDQICVKEGEISKNGDMLVCLPNKLLIQIVGKNFGGVDGISY